MIGEAVDAAYTLGWALLAWIVVGAVAVTAVVFGAGALLVLAGRWVWKGAARMLYGRESDEQPFPVAQDDSAPERAPQARTAVPGPIDLKDAA